LDENLRQQLSAANNEKQELLQQTLEVTVDKVALDR